MKIQEFCSKIAKEEGNKSQVAIGDVREIVKIINDALSQRLRIKNVFYAIIKAL